MRDRAKNKGDVIITNYNQEKWDATKVHGIKKLFCLIGTMEDDKAMLHSREHSCFCQQCIQGNFHSCVYAETSGQRRKEVVQKLPFKEKQVKANDLSEETLKVNFFKGNVPPLPVIPRNNSENDGDSFVLGIMTKKVRQLCNENTNEYTIDGIKKRLIIKKGTWCMTVKLLHKRIGNDGDYYIPFKAKLIKFSG